MTKIPGYTTTEDLPADVQALYELTAPLEGGPCFDLPAVRQYDLDFSKLTLHQAQVLLKRKWTGIRLRVVPNTFVESAPAADDDTPESPSSKKASANKPNKQEG